MFNLDEASADHSGILQLDLNARTEHFLPLSCAVYDIFNGQFDSHGYLTRCLRRDGKPFATCRLNVVDWLPMLMLQNVQPWKVDDYIGWRISCNSLHLWNITHWNIKPDVFGGNLESESYEFIRDEYFARLMKKSASATTSYHFGLIRGLNERSALG